MEGGSKVEERERKKGGEKKGKKKKRKRKFMYVIDVVEYTGGYNRACVAWYGMEWHGMLNLDSDL